MSVSFMENENVEQNTLQIEREIRASMLNLYRSRVRRRGDWFAEKKIHIFLNKHYGLWMHYQVFPIHAMFTNSVIWLLMLSLSFISLAFGIRNFVALASLGMFESKQLQLNWADSEKTPASRLNLGLYLFGCEIDVSRNLSFDENSVTMTFPNPVKFNGWFLEIPEGDQIPVHFQIRAQSTGNSSIIIGGSCKKFQYIANINIEWVFTTDCGSTWPGPCDENCTSEPGLPRPKCCRRGDLSRISFDHTWTWPMLLPAVLNIETALVLWGCLHLSSSQPTPRYWKLFAASAFGLPCLTYLLFCVLWLTVPVSGAGDLTALQAVLPATMTAVYFCAWILAYHLDQQHLPHLLFFFSAGEAAARVADLLLLAGPAPGLAHTLLAVAYPSSWAAVAAALRIGGRLHLAAALGRFRAYRARSDALCARLYVGDGACGVDAAVRRLRATRHSGSNPNVEPSPGRTGALCAGSGPSLVAATAGTAGELCVDRLLAQAALMQPLLNAKAALWAAAAGGRACSGDGDVLPLHGRLGKSPERLAERLLCGGAGSIQGEPDLCRQRIVFADLEGLARGLSALAADADVLVLGAENTLQAEPEAGGLEFHRGVTVRLSLGTQDAERLGIAGHVGELQLALWPLVVLQDDGCHRTYVACRNAVDCWRRGALPMLRCQLAAHAAAVAHWRFRESRPDNRGVTRPRTSRRRTSHHSDGESSALGGVEAWLLAACRNFCTLPGNHLTSQLATTYAAMARASLTSCFFTSTPFAAALSKPIFQAAALLVAGLYMLGAVMVATSPRELAQLHHRFYRFTALGFRTQDVSTSAAGPGAAWPPWRGLTEFGLLVDGCPVYSYRPLYSNELTQAGDSVLSGESTILNNTVDTGAAANANGWFFSVPAAGTAPDRFLLEGSDDAIGWRAVASDTVVVVQGVLRSRRVLFHDGVPGGSVLREARVLMDMRLGLGWLVPWMLIYLCGCACFCAVVVLQKLGAGHRIFRRAAALCYAVQLVPFSVAGAQHISEGRWRIGAPFLVRSTIPASFGYLLYSAENRFIYWLAPFGILMMVVDSALIVAFEGGAGLPPDAFVQEPFFLIGALATSFGLLCLATRQYFLVLSAALVQPDKLRYERIWSVVLQTEGCFEVLRQLQVLVSPFETKCSPRQKLPAVQVTTSQQRWHNSSYQVDSAGWSSVGSLERSSGLLRGLLQDMSFITASQGSHSSRIAPATISQLASIDSGRQDPVLCLDQLMAQAQVCLLRRMMSVTKKIVL